jgi:hypothetical protein
VSAPKLIRKWWYTIRGKTVLELEDPPVNSRDLIVYVDKKMAAINQLETAILLWFDYGDPVSIHALNKAANDLLGVLSERLSGKPSIFKEWLKSQPPSMRDRVRDIDNFFKHGHRDFNQELGFCPFIAEYLMMDSVYCYSQVYGKPTALMRLYWVRFAMCNRDIISATQLEPWVSEGAETYMLDRVTRREFFDKLWPAFASADIADQANEE